MRKINTKFDKELGSEYKKIQKDCSSITNMIIRRKQKDLDDFIRETLLARGISNGCKILYHGRHIFRFAKQFPNVRVKHFASTFEVDKYQIFQNGRILAQKYI